MSISKSLKARTTGRLKRSMKSAINPYYGKKGMGLVKYPKRAVYNKVYHKTTVGVNDIVKKTNNIETTSTQNTFYRVINSNKVIIVDKEYSKKSIKAFKNFFLVLVILCMLIGVLCLPIGIGFIIFGLLILLFYRKYKKIYDEMSSFEDE